MGAIIAGNFIYSNTGRAIYISGSSNVLVCYNTMIDNESGVSSMNRRRPAGDNRIFNNLFISNCHSTGKDKNNPFRGLDLRMSLQCSVEKYHIKNLRNQSDNNFYSDTIMKEPKFYTSWHDNFPLSIWQNKYGFDKNSFFAPANFTTQGWGIKIDNYETLKNKLKFAKKINYGIYKWRPKNPDTVGCDIYSWGIQNR